MPLESPVNYIQDLDAANPVDSDFVSVGAAHLRAIKQVLKNLGKHLPSLGTENLNVLSNKVTPTTCLFSVAPTSPSTSATLKAIDGVNLAPKAVIIITIASKSTPVTIAEDANVNGISLNGTSPLVMNTEGACMVLQRTSTNRWQELFRIRGVLGTASLVDVGSTSGTLVLYDDLQTIYQQRILDKVVLNDPELSAPDGTFRYISKNNTVVLEKNLSLDTSFTSTAPIVSMDPSGANFNVPIKYLGGKLLYQKSIVLTNTYIGEANYTFSHGLGKVLVPWGIYFKCIEAELGAAIGDIAPYWGFGSVGPAIISGPNDIRMRAINGAGIFNRSTNNYSLIHSGNWTVNLVCGEE